MKDSVIRAMRNKDDPRQFMIRVIRSTDGEYADVVVDADDPRAAETKALEIVRRNPVQWFGDPVEPHYYAELGQTEELEPGEYQSAT